MSEKARVGVVGADRWVDAMHPSALTGHALADVRGGVGSRRAVRIRTGHAMGLHGSDGTLHHVCDSNHPQRATIVGGET